MSGDYMKCCLCSESTGHNLLDLTVNTDNWREISDKLSVFNNIDTNLLLYKDSTNILCQPCNNTLNNAHEFYHKVQNTLFLLKQSIVATIVVDHQPLKAIFDDTENVNKKEDSVKSIPLQLNKPEITEVEIVVEKIEESSKDSADFTQPGVVKSKLEPEVICEEDSNAGSMSFEDYETDPSTEDESDDNLSEVSKELKNPSWMSYTWLCQHCSVQSAGISQYREHCKEAHNVCCGFKCGDCRDEFDKYEEFIEHVRNHNYSLRFFCQYCNLKLDATTAKSHREGHVFNEQICQHCGNIFDNITTLRQHLARYKPQKKPPSESPDPVAVTRQRRLKNRKPPPAQISEWQIRNIQDKSWRGYQWTCQSCGMSFPHVSHLRAHAAGSHKTCFAMKCIDCADQPDCYRGFVYHVRRHRPYLKGYCHYCNFKFDRPEDEADHLARHFDNHNKDCYSCGVIFSTREELEAHMAAYSPPKPKWLPYLRPEKPHTVDDLTCHVCKKVTTTPSGLRKHMSRHTERTKDHPCEICGNAFYSKSALNAHRKTHSETKSEVCEICKQSFKTLTYLKEHIKTHSDERPFQCEVCSKAFKRKRQLEEHFRIHTNDMPFQCGYCLKAFRHKTNLKVHEHQHTGARPFSCTDCDRNFSNWTNCNKHMKRKHGKTLAKKALTAQGKLPLDPTTGRPQQVDDSLSVQQWKQQILARRPPANK